jgi:N-carbamoyl-L-amino-acid hydrolase
VPAGGRFDGIAGVATGLEIARAPRDANVRPQHTIEIIDFLAEEPSEYGLSCVGSRGMTGAFDGKMLDLREPGGEKLRDALRRVGGDPDRLDQAKRGDIRAFLELHIEQGVVLESQSLDVGLVTSIVGIRRIEIVFQGEADHAGTTPMALRHDALVAAADTVVSVRRVAEQLVAEGADYFVATVGILTADPSASSIVPGRCRLVIDARTTDPALTTRFMEIVDRESLAHAAGARVTRGSLTILSDSSPVACDPDLRAALRRGAHDMGLDETDLAQWRRSRRGVHEPHLSIRDGFRSVPGRQEPRAGGMGGSRGYRSGSRGDLSRGAESRPIADVSGSRTVDFLVGANNV